jgi:hypothetical protein
MYTAFLSYMVAVGVLLFDAPTQRVTRAPALRIVQQTADSAVVVVRWVQSNADTVRVAWTYPNLTAQRIATGARRADTVRVAKGAAAQTISVTLTPKRGAVTGAVRTGTLSIPVRPAPPVPAPSIDSIVVDTARAGAPVVVPSPDTTPPAVPTAFTPNLPAGMRLIRETSFENWTDASRDADGIEVINWTNNTTENAATFGARSVTCNGGYGTKCFRTWFPGNHAGDGVGPSTLMVYGLNSRAHYMAVRMRYSPGYVLHTNGEKLFYPIGPELPTGGNGPAYAASMNVGGSGHILGYEAPIETQPPMGPLSGPNVVPIGRWFTAEFFAEMNTPGQANATLQVWIDGVRVVNKTGIMLSNRPTQQLFDRGRRDFTRGGGPSAVLTPPGGQWVEMDRLAFYAR